MSYAANLQSIFRSLSGALLVPNQQQQTPGQQDQIMGVGGPSYSQVAATGSLPGFASWGHRGSFSARGSNNSLTNIGRGMSSGSVVEHMETDNGQAHDHNQNHHHHHGHRHSVQWVEDQDQEESSDEMETDDEGTDDDESDEGAQDTQLDEEQQKQIQNQQQELRKRIMMIQQDTSIPAADKAKRIQELMTSGWSEKQQVRAMQSTRVTNRLANRRRDFDEVTDTDRQPTYYDKAGGILGCKHYQRASKLQAHCCGKWDTCRFCHDEVSDHNIVRNLITTMMCMYCGTVQPAGQDCINTACKRRVSKYYCKECKLWDSDPRKNIYHCYDCGICRIGKGLGIDYFHCKKCNVCMAISLRGRHKCIERNLESDCPICGEYMFTSTTTVIFMPCGHCIHYKCHQEYIQTSYQCPTCLKSLADMTDYFQRIDAALAQQQMPQEYENLYNQIYCNDCEKKCFAKFHFMYHKCTSCKGYNTKVLHTLDKCQVPTDQLRLVEDAAVSPNAATPTTAVNPEPPALDEQRRRSRSGSMVQRNVAYFCHQCQSSTHPVMVAGSQRCGTCDSDFLEQL